MLGRTVKRVSLLAVTFLLISCPAFSDELRDKENQAIQSAEAFLALVDSGKYEKSWDESSTFFRSQIPRAQWSAQLSALRPLFGEVISRSVKHTEYLTSAPGAPDGEYVLVVFQTSFENKQSAIERVTPMFEKDGRWRVTGYFIE